MRLSIDRLLGGLALAALLLLSGPGLRVAAADPLEELLSQASTEPQVCSPQASPGIPAGRLEAIAEQLASQAQQAEEVGPSGDLWIGDTPEGEPIILLNNRGFNYGPGPSGDLGALQRQLHQVLREQR